ncbi:MAG: hypothetical protein IT169_01275 [Bryobacterales bacterium]|nr:hypothetical protein [Bryobacterales bacterium]
MICRLPLCLSNLTWVCAVFLATIAALGQAPPQAAEPSAAQALGRALDAARAGDLATARATLHEGARAYPADPSFPTELAGLAFLEKRTEEAKRLLHRARRLGATDPYVNEFLGTLYLLDGNVEAALALWNPAGKPVLADGPLETGFEGILHPSLASGAVPFSSGHILTRSSLLRAERTSALLGVCGSERALLEAAEGDRYRAQFQCVERASFGENRVASVLMLARGLGYQTVHLHLPNLQHRAWSVDSMLRWDARKRRLWMESAMPLAGRAGWRIRADGDARHEYWQMLAPDTQAVDRAFLYRRVEAGVAVSAVLGPRTTWANRLSLANRSFANAVTLRHSTTGEPALPGGASVRYAHSLESDVYRNPFRRITATASGAGSFERYLATGSNIYRAEGAITLTWQPAANGDDGRTRLRVAAGALRGQPALPELFNIGMERDGGIPLRGHIGTQHGHKGSALYGDRYLASNLEVSKTLARLGVVTLSVAPFLDVAWVRDAQGRYGSRRTQFDAGLQWIAATPGGTEIRLSYAWDLRNRRQSFYAYSEPYP